MRQHNETRGLKDAFFFFLFNQKGSSSFTAYYYFRLLVIESGFWSVSYLTAPLQIH